VGHISRIKAQEDAALGRAWPYVWSNPGKAIDRAGRVIDTSREVWTIPVIGGVVSINWNLVTTAADVKDAMRAFVFHSVERQAAEAAGTVYNYLKYLARQVGHLDSVDDLTFERMEAVLADLRAKGSAWKFGYVRRWYRWCCNQEIPGFSLETTDRLYRLKIPSDSRGHPVMTRDPDDGPFSDEEHFLIRQSIKQGRGTILKRVCVMLLLEIAARPVQLVALQASDFKVVRSPTGNHFYTVDVPRAKQRRVGAGEKKTRRISKELGEEIEKLIGINCAAYGVGRDQLPLLYPPPEETRKQNRPGEPLECLTRAMLLYHVHRYARSVGIISPGTGEILNMFPYRFRYTFGVRHANQGTPKAVLAELLDHTTLVAVGAYTNSSSNSVDRLNSTLGSNPQYTAVIDRFTGTVTEGAGEGYARTTIRGTTPTLKDLGGIGSCGADFMCDLMPPLSCYGCPKFQAWADGPHEKMKFELVAHAKRLDGKTGNPSNRIPRQLDDTIAAIDCLLVKIKGRRSAGEGGDERG
jgi:hypothetical protein